MDFSTLAGLVQIDLRGGATLRLSDGGIVKWGSDTFEAVDSTFGAIGTLDPLTEGIGDEVPALRMTFLPNSGSAAADLSQPGWQGSRVRLWIAAITEATGVVSGAPELIFDGQLDSIELASDRGVRTLEMDIVSTAERLFSINEGNYLNPRFQKLLFAGDTGEDNATGLGITVAWGAASPPGTAIGGSYGSGGGGGFFNGVNVDER